MGRPLSDTISSEAHELAAIGLAGRLTLYVGAGVSAAAPSNMPLGLELVGLLEEPARNLGLDVRAESGQVKNLEQLADEAEAAGSLRALKFAIVGLEVFRRGPNEGHELIAILLREGLVTVLSANWDLGIERGGAKHDIYLPVTVTDDDRLRSSVRAGLHKLHGCVTKPDTLLVSTQDLSDVPDWARTEAEAALSGGTVAFVGIGTVADYVGVRVDQILGIAGDEATVWVVGRSLSEPWKERLATHGGWRSISARSDEFLDDLARAVVVSVIGRVVSAARRMVEENSGPERLVHGAEQLRDSLMAATATEAWQWCGSGSVEIEVGSPAMSGTDAVRALLGVAHIINSKPVRIVGGGPNLAVEAEVGYLEPVIADGSTAGVVVGFELSRSRARELAGVYRDPSRPIIHVVAGHIGRLPDSAVIDDLVSTADAADLVVGPAAAQHHWVSAHLVVEGADERWT